MADIRVTVGSSSRVEGTQVGIRLNVFGMTKLEAGVTGDVLAEIAMEVLQPSLEEAVSQWPVLTGASRDSMSLQVAEVGERHARVVLQVGGEQLVRDARNTSHKDYAPFIEFNGTPSAPPGIIFNSIYGRDAEIRAELHKRASDHVRSLLR